MMSRHLSMTTGGVTLVHVALQQLAQVFGTEVTILLPGPDGALAPPPGAPAPFLAQDGERGVGEWVFRHAEPAGAGTDTLPGAAALYLPLQASQGTAGVLALRPPAGVHLGSPEQRQLLQTMANQIALALERDALAQAAQTAHVEAESERLRSSLLSSVSHDLRTPLAVIEGASSALLQQDALPDPRARREMLASIHEQSVRLSRLIRNLLDMTRLEAGSLKPQREWHTVEELAGSALRQMEGPLGNRPVRTTLPPDLPLVHVDGVLVEQLLINLLDNAVKHAPGDMPIDLSARVETGERGRELVLEVADRGPGLREEDLPRLFDKFWRGAREGTTGAGLGLAICRGIAQAHGGTIEAEQRAGGGALFRVRLPAGEHPPAVASEPEEPPRG
jgi:two-component system sensor histidine kinase KdpD